MATFRDRMEGHITTTFLNTNHFAEEVTYTPDGGSGTTIDAIVQRHPVSDEEIGPDGNAEVHRASIYIDVADVAMPTRGDRISSTGPDGETEDWGVNEKQVTEGMWRLECILWADRQIIPPGSRREV